MLSLSLSLSLYAMLLEELAAALVSDFIFGQVEHGLDLWLVILFSVYLIIKERWLIVHSTNQQEKEGIRRGIRRRKTVFVKNILNEDKMALCVDRIGEN